MSTVVTSDAAGALMLPAEVLQEAGVAPGTELVAEVAGGRIVVGRVRPPIWERIAALAADAPPDELDKLPTDGAAQLDHYLYGHPKRVG